MSSEAAYKKSLNDLTVIELKKRLVKAGLAKGNSGLRKSEIIDVLLADKGYGSKSDTTKSIRARRHDEYVKNVKPKRTPAPKRPPLKRSQSSKDISVKRESPRKSESPKRVSASKPKPSSPFFLESLQRSSPPLSRPKPSMRLSLEPLPIKRRTPPPPLPRDLPVPIVNEYLRACATTDEKEAKRIIGCLCKKFPNIVRCAKKGEKVKPGEFGMSLHSRSPSRSPRKSPPRSPPVPTSPAPSPSRASSPKVALLVKAGSPSIPYAKIPIPPAPPAPPVFIPSRKPSAAAARATVKVQTCAPNEVMGGSGVCIKLQRPSSADKFNPALLNRALASRRDVIADSLERDTDDSDWD